MVRRILLALICISAFLVCSNIQLLWHYRTSLQPAPSWKASDQTPTNPIPPHPIDTLMKSAETTFQNWIAGRSSNVHAAAKSYRSRRGRQPPPGFDVWYEYAYKHDALIIEELFDQIYRDLAPFWAITPKAMRDFAKNFEHHIIVRNGTANMTDKHTPGTQTDRMEAWLELVQSVEQYLPDLDMAVNVMDESRVIAPWEDIDKYIRTEKRTRKLLSKDKVYHQYQKYEPYINHTGKLLDIAWTGPGQEAFWDIARAGCAPQAPARYRAATTNFSGPPLLSSAFPKHSPEGYVKNWTEARDPCQQPHLQEAHGTFIEPISISTTRQLVPIFGESKLTMNNDILIPAAAYISASFDGGMYSGSNTHGKSWAQKTPGVVWRGVASGGRNRKENWTRFHRHRFVSMLNGSYVRAIEMDRDSVGEGQTIVPESYSNYHLPALGLGQWLDRIADVGFTDLLCWPGTGEPTCSYTDAYFSLASTIPMPMQFDYKILPDVDGNSFSGRYLSFIRSTSLPLKATIYSEWHDDRLIPWLHFVPIDNMFVDVYGILDYFLGAGIAEKAKNDSEDAARAARDDAAQKIALRGKEWAEKALRREDMQVYMLRLLLEYARLCDDNRDRLGYVGDVQQT